MSNKKSPIFKNIWYNMLMTYEELFQKYCEVIDENKTLKHEIDLLRLKLQCNTSQKNAERNIPSENLFAFSNNSTPEEKISLFMNLFKGRTDIYAKRWYSIKTKKSGYQPVCGNEWDKTLCDKKKYKCSVCPNRKLIPLEKTAIENHLRGIDDFGRDVIGIYPLLNDETCNFISVDFDEKEFEKDTKAFAETCVENNISVAIERSRSGKGAHVWIFFETPIKATLARKLGASLLSYTMNKRSDISFKSYDRLFPNQDTMPKGGFGNLIALPLQGLARKNGNSIFVTNEFIPHSDQWNFLSTLKKLSQKELKEVLQNISAHNDVEELFENSISLKNDKEKPWIKKEIRHPLTKNDFDSIITIIESNRLYLERKGLSPVCENYLKRLAAFKNPDFYKSQAMRLPVYNKPRIIDCSQIHKDYISLPRGAKEKLESFLQGLEIDYRFEDKTNHGKNTQIEFTGELREEQLHAAESLLGFNNGVLSATTGFGKTVIASFTMSKIKVNTLILVHTQALLGQWKKSLEHFLEIKTEIEITESKKGKRKKQSNIGILGGGKNTLNGIVDIAIIQSLIHEGEVKELIKDYGLIIVDECHHISAFSFEKVLNEATARYIYGLTATPKRSDGHDPIIHFQCGEIRHQIDALTQSKKRTFEHFLIPQLTSFRTLYTDTNITNLYTIISQDELRNKQIADDIKESLKAGRKPIILTERKEHVFTLQKLLEDDKTQVITLIGTKSAKEKRIDIENIEKLSRKSQFVIIATGKYVGEGFDCPILDTLFLALPIAWKGKLTQYAGRLHRECEGKSSVEIYDYIDIHIPVFERMYHKRLKGYSDIGYMAKVIENKSNPSSIFTEEEFIDVFNNDIIHAKKSIVIVSPYINKQKIQKIAFSSAILNKVHITIVTKEPEVNTEKKSTYIKQNIILLEQLDIKVKISNCNTNFAIIDDCIVWYGNVGILSKNLSDNHIMRLESIKIANELIKIIS